MADPAPQRRRSQASTVPAAVRKVVEAATVSLRERSGQGVLVPGGFVLTAAHCTTFDCAGAMALGDHFLEHVELRSGAKFRMQLVAVEPKSDIAVLSAADGQTFYREAKACEDWIESTEPVRLRETSLRLMRPVIVHVLTHRGAWIHGTATRWDEIESGVVCIETETPIEGGTSGGPIVDNDGRLVGVASLCAETSGEGMAPFASFALPSWVLRIITNASARRRRAKPRARP